MPAVFHTGRGVTSKTATIALNGTTSAAIDTSTGALLGIQMPAALTSTTLTFTVSYDGTTYQPLYDETNAQVSITVAASRAYAMLPYLFAPWAYVKLVFGSSEAAARTIGLTLIGV